MPRRREAKDRRHPLAEREHVGLDARSEEGDLDSAVGDRPSLANQLIKPLPGHRPMALLVDVEPVSVAGRLAVEDMRVEYPVALDSDYAIWEAFSNRYWPAVYIADANGGIRHHHFGEGGYEDCELVVQRLLREAGGDGIPDDLVSVVDDGFEAQADWANLEAPETYLGYDQGQNFASPGGAKLDQVRTYVAPERLKPNQWALSGDWTVGRGACVLDGAGGRIAFRFHARDVHLVMGPPARGTSVPFTVLVDGEPPGGAHGIDVDEQGHGTLSEQRLHQLIRARGSITDRTFEITFLAPGVEAYAFTFG